MFSSHRCHECDKQFATKVNLKNHMHNHAPAAKREYKCEQCSNSYLKSYKLAEHIRATHSSKKVGRCSCDICDKTYYIWAINIYSRSFFNMDLFFCLDSLTSMFLKLISNPFMQLQRLKFVMFVLACTKVKRRYAFICRNNMNVPKIAQKCNVTFVDHGKQKRSRHVVIHK